MHNDNDEYLQLNIFIHAECKTISDEAAARPSHLQRWPNSMAMQPQGFAASQGKTSRFSKTTKQPSGPPQSQSFWLVSLLVIPE